MPFPRPDSETPFRILVLGDFGATAAAASRPLEIDRDKFDGVMKRMDVRLAATGGEDLRFSELEDFHPDRLFESSRIFRVLRDLRTHVGQPEAFRHSAAELLRGAEERQPENEPELTSSVLSSGGLLDQIVESSETGAAPAAARMVDPFRKYLHSIVAPHLAPGPDPKQADMLAQVEGAITEQMRAVLREPRFQALEAAWRGLDFLVRRADTNSSLKIYVMHLPKRTLAGDLLPSDDLRRTAIYRVLVEETVGTPGGEPWAMVAANYGFGPRDEDVELLGRIALLAAAAGCPVIASADAALLGDGKELAAWKQLQAIPEAACIGLAMPRFLLRLPYGKETNGTDAFPFEEISGEPKHGDYVWGNPAFACAYLMAEAFSASGWEMRPGDSLDIEDLPAHSYKKDGETVLQPCAEVLMTESEAQGLIERGLIPLLSIKGSDRVRVGGFRSIAGGPLAGRWS